MTFLKGAKTPKLKRWRAYIEGHNVQLKHRKGESMNVSDGLSRLFKPGQPGTVSGPGIFLKDMQEEMVVAKIESEEEKFNEIVLEKLFTIEFLHRKNGHASAEKLFKKYPDLATQEIFSTVVRTCPECILNKKVRSQKQGFGSLPETNEKNDRWHIDYVFPKINGKKKTCISVCDQATRFFIIEEVTGMESEKAKRIFEKIFSYLGKPKTIVRGNEKSFVSLVDFFNDHGITVSDLPRATSWCLLVERYHSELKKYLDKNPKFSLKQCQNLLNDLPFTNINFLSSPASLFFNADEKGIKKLNKVRNEKRKEDIAPRKDLKRNISVGDLVKSNKLKRDQQFPIDFGIVKEIQGSKFFLCERINAPGSMFKSHLRDLEKIPFSKKYFQYLTL